MLIKRNVLLMAYFMTGLYLCIEPLGAAHSPEQLRDMEVHEETPQDSLNSGSELQAGSGNKGTVDAPTEWRVVPEGHTSDIDLRRQTEFRGNWFNKRKIVQDIRVVAEKVASLVASRWQGTVNDLMQEATSLMQALQSRIRAVGFSVDDITRIEQQMTDPVQRAGKVSVSSSAQHREDVLREVSSSLHTIAQKLQFLFEALAKSEEVTKVVHEQSSLGPNYNKEVWALYQKADDAYSDEYALQLYKEVQTRMVHLEYVFEHYFGKELKAFCHKLDIDSLEAVSSINKVREELMKKNIFLREKDRPQEQEKPAKQEEKKPTLSWWYGIWLSIKGCFVWIGEAIGALFGRIGSKS